MPKKTKIIHYRTNTPAGMPAVGNVDLGEIAVNTFKGVLFTKKDDGVELVKQVGLVNDDPSPLLSANIDGNTFLAKNFSDPVDPQDLVTKQYVDDIDNVIGSKIKFYGEVTTFQSTIDVMNAFSASDDSDIYKITFSDFFTNSGSEQDLYMRFSTNNLTTTVATGYEMEGPAGGGNVTDLSSTTELFLGKIATGTTSPLSGSITLFNPARAVNKSAFVLCVSNVGGGQPVAYYTHGLVMNNTSLFNSLRFFASGGSVKGKFTGYTIKTSVL